MDKDLPDAIPRDTFVAAIRDLDAGIDHAFGPSSGYDVLFEGRRYPPKAVVGLAARRVNGRAYGPNDLRGVLGTKCFRVLVSAGFDIVTKGAGNSFPNELPEGSRVEGAACRVLVNRYERDPVSRERCIANHGCRCQVCGMDFFSSYGAVGVGFIHVHHLVPLSSLGGEYEVDPVRDLRPICPNCHAMLHRRTPPFSVEELRAIVAQVRSNNEPHSCLKTT